MASRKRPDGGKIVHARVRKGGESTVTEERTWGAHEKVAVKRVEGVEV